MRSVVEKFRRNVYEVASDMEESGDDVFRLAIVNLLCPLLGGEIYDGDRSRPCSGWILPRWIRTQLST
jgi:hypothetical protein